MGTKKLKSELKSMIFEIDGKVVEKPLEKISVYADSWPCDLCGSHGEVKLVFSHEDKLIRIQLEEW